MLIDCEACVYLKLMKIISFHDPGYKNYFFENILLSCQRNIKGEIKNGAYSLITNQNKL
jgi:hypothetical protein